MRTVLYFSFLALFALAVIGVGAVGSVLVLPQEVEAESIEADWRMISGDVDFGGASHDSAFANVYLYNARTGVVYGVFATCTGAPNGCVLPLPIELGDGLQYDARPPP